MALITATTLGGASAPSIYDFTVNQIDGKPVSFAAYRGKVMVVVNVASKCGFTPQYEGLEALHRKYKDRGLVILGFPSNDFMWQEPGNNAEIAAFCQRTYGVSFPMFAKVSVRGGTQHPVYGFLTNAKGRVTWNFNKFLVAKDGRVIEKYGSTVKPEDPAFLAAIEKSLN